MADASEKLAQLKQLADELSASLSGGVGETLGAAAAPTPAARPIKFKCGDYECSGSFTCSSFRCGDGFRLA